MAKIHRTTNTSEHRISILTSYFMQKLLYQEMYISLVPGASISFVLTYLPILSQSESRLKTQTLAHLEFACWLILAQRSQLGHIYM